MKGIVVRHQGHYEKEGQIFSDGNQSSLIFQRPDMEIIFDIMPKGTVGFFFPPEDDDMMDANFIISGKMEICDIDEIILLEAGDFFCLERFEKYIMFQVLEDVQAIYINNRPYYNQFEHQVSDLVQIMNQLQEADGDTLLHCERVKTLCMGIAYHMRFDQTQLRVLFYAARFHDVGKSKIPLEILVKPARLTNEEYEIMKLHSQYTYEMILEHYGEEIAKAAYEHHEHLDGTGYPNHLKGEDIGMPARIICVADAYDAMVATRPYHAGKAPKDAIAELWRCAGKQFDEQVIRALESYLTSRGEAIS